METFPKMTQMHSSELGQQAVGFGADYMNMGQGLIKNRVILQKVVWTHKSEKFSFQQLINWICPSKQ